MSNLDFDVVPTKQLEGVARLYWLGFDSSHIVLPIYSYRMQVFAWRRDLLEHARLPLPKSAKVLPKQLSLIPTSFLFQRSSCSSLGEKRPAPIGRQAFTFSLCLLRCFLLCCCGCIALHFRPLKTRCKVKQR